LQLELIWKPIGWRSLPHCISSGKGSETKRNSGQSPSTSKSTPNIWPWSDGKAFDCSDSLRTKFRYSITIICISLVTKGTALQRYDD
jgi:hypothetical protein